MPDKIIATLAPWLSVDDGPTAIQFYKLAFGAREAYRMEDPGGGVVVRLVVGNSEFWVSAASSPPGNTQAALGGNSVRMILVVDNPDAAFAKAIEAGATAVFPVGEGHGWRLGRLADPFGMHWEIGKPLTA